jgi:HSP20 family protein
MMSAQDANQSTTQNAAKEEQRGNQQSKGQQRNQESQSALARRSSASSLPSLWADPMGLLNPFALMRRMQEELNQAFSQPGLGAAGRADDFSNTIWVPAVEVAYRDGNFVVSAELPGLTDEDVTVEVDDDAVVIQGERQVEHEETQGGIHRTERRYGQFYRAIPLPEGANPAQARAEFKDGVLEISVPVSQAQSNARQVPIEKTGSSQASSAKTGEQTGKRDTRPQSAEQGAKKETPSGQKAA